MPKSKIKGLTIEIGGDTTDLSKALKEPNQEANELQSKLRAVNQALKLDPENTDILEQKFRLLGQAIDVNERKLQMLKTAQEQFIASGNDIDSAEYIELQRQIALTTKRVNDLRSEKIEMTVDTSGISKADSDLDSLDKSIDDVKDSANDLKESFSNAFSSSVLAETGQSIMDTMSGIVDESKEYIKIMGSLETASSNLNYTNDETEASYTRLYAVLGDNQSAATATSNLQALGMSQADLTQMIDGAIGAWAQYGDSIPIDGLAESINETAKTATVTGQFADVLNWAGMSEDEFNDKLASTSSLSERSNMILQALANQGLVQSAEKWRENNKALVDSNLAQAELEKQTASMAETLLPIFTTINSVLSTVIGMFNSLPGPVQTVITVILGLVSVMTMLSPVVIAVTTAVTALNIPLLPLVGIIAGIIAAITAVILVFQNWGSIVEFFSNLFDSAISSVKSCFESAVSSIDSGIKSVIKFFNDLKTKILISLSNIIDNVVSFASNMYSNAVSAGSNFVNGVMEFIFSLPSQIASVLGNLASSAFNWGKDMINGFINGIKSMIGNVVSAVKNVADTITSWLHFSRPDVGPLREYEKWMPDMMKGLAKGIRDNRHLVTDEMRGLSNSMDMSAQISKTLKYNASTTVVTPVEVDLDGKVIYKNVVRRITQNQSTRTVFQGG